MECAVSFCTWRHLHASKSRVCISTCQNHNIVTIPLFLSQTYLFLRPRESFGAVDKRQADGNRINKIHDWWTMASFSHRCRRSSQHSFPIMWKAEGRTRGSRTAYRRHRAAWVRVRVRVHSTVPKRKQQFSDNSLPGYLYFKCIGHVDCSFILRPVIC